MNARQLVLAALRREATPRVPWVPFVGCHGGQLIGRTATDYLSSADLIVEGLSEAKRRYRPDGLPVVFDLQVEAQVLGCALQWADDSPPSVVSHPMSVMEGQGLSLDALPAFGLDKGRVPLCLDATRRMREQFGDDLALYGLITGPFTLAMHLLGNDLFMLMYDEPDKVKAVCAHAAMIGGQLAAAYLDAGADVIAVVDPMVSQISPEHFAQFVAEPANAVFDAIHDAGGLGSMFVCGDATRNLEVMADTRCDNVSIDEQIPLQSIKTITAERGKSFGGNMKLTVALLLGDADDARGEAVSCLDAGGELGFVLSPGCDLPFAVPRENLEAVGAVVHDPYQREVARTLGAKQADTFDDIVLPDYAGQPGVRVDVVTLNSASCAPCQYMFKAALDARGQLEQDLPVTVHEHKIINREGIGMMVKLGVSNLPTICIEGRPVFESITPSRRMLTEAIRQSAEQKLAGQGA